MEDGLCLTESVIRALRAMRFTIHAGLKITPLEENRGRKPRKKTENRVNEHR